MDRGAWLATVHSVAESDASEATKHSTAQRRDLSSSPVVETSPSDAVGGIQFLVRELRFHVLHGQKPKHKPEAML